HTRFSRDWSSDVCSSDLGHGDQSRVLTDAVALRNEIAVVALFFKVLVFEQGQGLVEREVAWLAPLDSTAGDLHQEQGVFEAVGEDRKSGVEGSDEWHGR